jgi:uncharacterized RDD family membrane protein YckC
LYCPKCGAEVAEGATFCGACGQPIAASESGQPDVSPEAGSKVARRRPMVYAGFWLRAAAYLLDSIVLSFPVGIFILRPLMERAGIPPDNPWVLFTGTSRQIIAINLLGTLVSWLYWALLESSRWQGTVGKKMLGLQVTDLAGRRISFARATGRYFGKVISALLLFVGFAMAGFTEKKQALHDMFASCLVLKKT